ncbi:lantibiotic dehydratase family protein [Aquimarina sp. 2201CG14-23]|uniref:lantibiotic dehydratase family protein n=1 Tax=Aquimarina mycalae TaxID=3040073 RepID=UPI002477F36C|nr:lantibiotic dehydratase family protein [Aquimarina sp. 2201CG14-23]MDH7446917.1 lantibiotic dehydratase family protein [Aquimarina sp. 2201CG14-23]
MNSPYTHFPKYLLRSPLLPFSFYEKLTSKTVIQEDDLKEILKDPILQEAVFLASPDLHGEIEKWLLGNIKEHNKTERLQHAVFKYISRMSSRCTPFGLFAGCAVGSFSNRTNIIAKGAEENQRHTRLDMNYLVALSQELVRKEPIRNQLLFYPNNSIYRIYDKLRYVEYKYDHGQRQNHIVEVDDSFYLDVVLKKAKKGSLLTDLAKTLVDDNITLQEASSFINSLIDNQLLISELEPSVSGNEFMEHIFSTLHAMTGIDELVADLKIVDQNLKELDLSIGNPSDKYIKISESLKTFGTGFSLKHLFQSDMINTYQENTLDDKIANDIQKGLALLNKLTLPPKSTMLSNFKDAFFERFEEREISLSKALDVEMGVGYSQNHDSGIVNSLVDDLFIPSSQNKHSERKIKWNIIDSFFQKKLVQAYKENAYTITIEDKDFEDLETNWDDLPDTISCIVEVLKDDSGKEKIKFKGGGGSSAANLLGRFCHADHNIYDYVKEIVAIENEINQDKILAEIVHLPESRAGNILMRPDLRKFEIPYLANSTKPSKEQIQIDDLLVSVKQNTKVFLRSKKHNKEVLPRLSNAHNYSYNSVPAYHFLSDLQTQNKRSGVFFDLGPFANEYEFLPRIEYRNLILHPATWNLNKTNIKEIVNNINDENNLLIAVKNVRDKYTIPKYILLVEGDNELLINLENVNSIQMWIQQIKKKSNFKITEFLFTEKGIVANGNQCYTNQIVVSFYNQKKM